MTNFDQLKESDVKGREMIPLHLSPLVFINDICCVFVQQALLQKNQLTESRIISFPGQPSIFRSETPFMLQSDSFGVERY